MAFLMLQRKTKPLQDQTTRLTRGLTLIIKITAACVRMLPLGWIKGMRKVRRIVSHRWLRRDTPFWNVCCDEKRGSRSRPQPSLFAVIFPTKTYNLSRAGSGCFSFFCAGDVGGRVPFSLFWSQEFFSPLVCLLCELDHLDKWLGGQRGDMT
jgi:hypothetical protein